MLESNRGLSNSIERLHLAGRFTKMLFEVMLVTLNCLSLILSEWLLQFNRIGYLSVNPNGYGMDLQESLVWVWALVGYTIMKIEIIVVTR